MTFNIYRALIAFVRSRPAFTFRQPVFYACTSRLPLTLIGVSESTPVVRVPERATNTYGNAVQVLSLAASAFAGNKTVTDVILPYYMSSIAPGAFTGCTRLKNVTIPKSVKKIGANTFEGCVSLENVFYGGTPEEWAKIEIVHEKHEIEFGELIPGRPVHSILAERNVIIPGNEALFSANVHFRCDLRRLG